MEESRIGGETLLGNLIQQASLFPLEERAEKVFQRLVKYNMTKEKTNGLIRRNLDRAFKL